MDILRYVLVDRNNSEDDHEYEDYAQALHDASRSKKAIVQRTYTYDDSELIWTPDGSDAWPPKENKR